ncbi:MAG: hypothetical protein Kow00109_21220 [Acidobacteriota bacterium]
MFLGRYAGSAEDTREEGTDKVDAEMVTSEGHESMREDSSRSWRRSRWSKGPTVARVLCVGLAALALAACGGDAETPAQGQRQGGPQAGAWGPPGAGPGGPSAQAVTVRAYRVKQRPISSYIIANTTLEAVREVTVYSRVSANVVELFAEEGDIVRQGQLLCRLEDREIRNELEQAEIAVRQAEVSLEQAQVRARLSEASFQRAKTLFEQGLMSQEEFDQVRLQNDTDALALTNAQRQVEAARARLEAAQIQLDYTTVESPINGVVTQRLIDVGDRVNMNEVLFTIQEFPPLWARIYVPERYLPSLRIGEETLVRFDSLPGREFRGRIKLISPTVDANTGTVKVTVELNNTSNVLRPGMFGTVYIATETRPNAVVVPKKAVVRERDQNYVYVINEDNTVTRRQVQLGLAEEDYVEITQGVQAGEAVVTVGVETLNDGYPVMVQAWEDGGGELQQAQAPPAPAGQPAAAPGAGPAAGAAGPFPTPAAFGPPGAGPGGGFFQQLMADPEIRKRWEAKLKEDPSMATDPAKRRAFIRQIMSERQSSNQGQNP